MFGVDMVGVLFSLSKPVVGEEVRHKSHKKIILLFSTEEESSCFPLCSSFLLWQTTTACSDLVHDLKAKELLS